MHFKLGCSCEQNRADQTVPCGVRNATQKRKVRITTARGSRARRPGLDP